MYPHVPTLRKPLVHDECAQLKQEPFEAYESDGHLNAVGEVDGNNEGELVGSCVGAFDGLDVVGDSV